MAEKEHRLPFCRVSRRMWHDARFRALTMPGKLCFAYLLTGPAVTSLPGVLVLGRGQMADDMGSEVSDVEEMLAAETARIVLEEMRDATPPPQKAPLLSKSQIAQALGVSVATVDREVAEGMPCVIVGASRRFDFDAVRAWLEAKAATRLANPPKGSAAPVRLLSRTTRKAAAKAA